MQKPPSSVNWFYVEAYKNIPQTTTQEMLEMGRVKGQRQKRSSKNRFNAQSLHFVVNQIKPRILLPLTTSYKRDYAPPYEEIPNSRLDKENIPDHLWNRKPMNDFAVERITSSEFKFMDDHLIDITPERRKVNFFRQLRNQHYPLV
ncbi:uncharacterized protein LOC119612220 [Lucilia sericata]|uniref:uncharacterized protein LOC119612220 n=1 Tax=Lucilia sericata TaxID=13632 RepID=UPI0018A842FC|nr:uncharacterized protein LOC119612220 [Lucilia sericata]